MKRLVVCGSPRVLGRSGALAEALSDAYALMGDEVERVNISEVRISPCTGCSACELCERTPGIDNLYCIIADDMRWVRERLNGCDELTVVCPVYFAGVPAQFKAFLDRLQPYYFSTEWRAKPKRAAHLFVVGEGGDPHGFAPLVGEVRSALAVAGFSLDTVHDWVGKVDADGAISFAAWSCESPETLLAENAFSADEYLLIDPAGIRPDGAFSRLKASLTRDAACVSVRPMDGLEARSAGAEEGGRG